MHFQCDVLKGSPSCSADLSLYSHYCDLFMLPKSALSQSCLQHIPSCMQLCTMDGRYNNWIQQSELIKPPCLNYKFTHKPSFMHKLGWQVGKLITPRACTRGQAIGFVCCLSVITTKIARSRVLGICTCYNYNKSVKNWFLYALNC